jgi:hypothetical protein
MVCAWCVVGATTVRCKSTYVYIEKGDSSKHATVTS